MILTKVRLKNFLSHDDTQIEFSPFGITAIIGENGAGKSSVLEAIQFALFGESSKGNQIDLIKWGRNEASVELEFIKGNKKYKIVRKIEKKGKNTTTTALLYRVENTREILDIQKHLNQELPKITGLSKKTFLNSILIKQGEIEGLIRQKPSEREKIIEELLDLHIYSKLLEKYKENRKKEENRLETLQSEKIDKEELTQSIKNIQNQIYQLQEEIKKIEEEKKQLEESLKEVETKINTYNQIEREKSIKLTDLKNLEDRITQLQSKIDEISNLKSQIDSLKIKVEELKNLEAKYDKLQEIKSLNIKLNQIQKEIDQTQEKINFKKEFEPIYNQILEKQEELKQIKEKITKLENLKGEISQIEKLIQQKEKEYIHKKSNYDHIVNQLLTFNRKFQMLQQNPLMIQEHIEQNTIKIEHLEKEINKIKEEKASVEGEGKQIRKRLENINSIQGECPTCGRPLEDHKKEEILKDLEKTLEEKRNQYSKLKQEEENLEKELNKQKQIRELLIQLKPLYDSIKEVENEKKTYEAKLNAFKHQIKDLDTLKEKETHISNFIDKHIKDYGYYQKLLKENLEENFKNLLIEKEKIENQLKEKIDTNPTDIENEIQEVKQKIENLKPERDRYNQNLSKISEEPKILEELEKIKKEKENLFVEIEKLNEKLKDLDISGLYSQKDSLQKHITEKNSYISEKKQELGNLQGQENILSQQLKKAQEQEEEMERLNVKIKRYYKIENALQQLQKLLKDNALYNLPKITEDIFSKFGFNQFINLKFTEKYEITLTANAVSSSDIAVKVDSLSGGQRIALSLALRLAIAKMLNEKADFLILDEPTIHLDESRKRELIDLLGDLKESNFIKQLIIVTHDDEIEERADIIYKVSYGSVIPVG
ncbi:AAA family ATPase [Sulfurihydrogenibium sp.]|uniref:AAA family ATPase n=1 Tax=Sulfurihydrogenibium sp. TaxID=2053621 RepID=UPI0026399A58|nr:AAA family ATPase [Sulfurihydrogenibium sp.]